MNKIDQIEKLAIDFQQALDLKDWDKVRLVDQEIFLCARGYSEILMKKSDKFSEVDRAKKAYANLMNSYKNAIASCQEVKAQLGKEISEIKKGKLMVESYLS